MTNNDIARLLDRAGRSYEPDTSHGLAEAKTRAARYKRGRRTVSLGVGLLVVVVSATIGLVLTVQGGSPANAVPYLSIAPTARVVSLSSPSNGLTDVYFADNVHGIGMEQNCSLSPTINTTCSLLIARTSDGGKTWLPVGHGLHLTYADSRASYPFINFATNGKDGWIYGSETYVTHDGGKTFAPDGPGGLVMDLSIVGTETWAVSRACPPGTPGCVSVVYSTPTGGGPWHAIHEAPTLYYPYLQLLRTSAENAFLVAEATDGTLYVTENGGQSWSSHALPPLCSQLQHFTALSKHDLWVLCAGATPTDVQTKELYHSVDIGNTWTLVATSNAGAAPGVGTLPTSGIVTLLTSVAPDRLLIAVDRGPVITSTDGGKTWIPQGLPADGGVEQLTFADAQHGWAVLFPKNTLYRTSDGGEHWVAAGDAEG
jgi:photosystem II stability/assembly factor-like uncharacterized protein